MKNDFQKRLVTGGSDKKYHDPIKRNKMKTFKQTAITCVVKKNKETTSVEVNRNILGALLSFSLKCNKPIDFDAALRYPLSPVPLSIATPDGSKRPNSKSLLMDVIVNHTSFLSSLAGINRNGSTLIVDLIADIRLQTDVPSTYEELIWRYLSNLPKGYTRVDLVTDTYRENSIKRSERKCRGSFPKVMIGSSKSKIPRDYSGFMKNGDNKTRLVELIAGVITELLTLIVKGF